MTWLKQANPFAEEDLGKCPECGKVICTCVQDEPSDEFPMNEKTADEKPPKPDDSTLTPGNTWMWKEDENGGQGSWQEAPQGTESIPTMKQADPMSSDEWHDYLGSEELTQKLDKMTQEELREFQDGLSEAFVLIDDVPSAYQGQTGLGKNPNKQRIIELAQSILPLIKELRELIG